MGGKMSHEERSNRMSQSSRGKNSQCEQIKGAIDKYEKNNCDNDGCEIDEKGEKMIKKTRDSVEGRAGMSKKCKKLINDKLDDIEKRKKKIQPDIKF